jgi:membrane-associated protease RseP (regulator of RpoE activity)
MTYLLRPNFHLAIATLAALGAAVLSPQPSQAQGAELAQLMQEPSPLLMSSSSQGYLGVLVGDVDADSATKLKLKEVRGAVITLIDHDAPAGQILKVNDVVLELNGQPVEGAEQLRRMLHEIPPGRKVTLLISRDGSEQTTTTQMGDHKKIVEGFWTKIGNGEDVLPANGPGMNLMSGDAPSTGIWRFDVLGGSLKVGAMVEPLTSQMAEYLGVQSGIMVKQVARKTEADTAGLKAFDVIVKVGAEPIATIADWERALHSNQGKGVQLTILRDKKQQTLTLQVDSKHTHGELEMEELFPQEDCPMVAMLGQEPAGIFGWDSNAAADGMRRQAQELRDRMKDFKFNSQQAEEMRKQAEQLRDSLKGFKVDQRQLDELKEQTKTWEKSFNSDEFKQQLQEWQKNFNSGQFKIDRKQFDEMQQRMEEWMKQFQTESQDLDPRWI